MSASTKGVGRATATGVGALLLLVVVLVWQRGSEALPQYTARSGRTCDNCHSVPNDWVDPPLLDRKCTLSCASCHYDPTGGGLRNVSGMYYGTQTLPAFGATQPPWDDRGSQLFGLLPPFDPYLEAWRESEAAAGSAQEPTSHPGPEGSTSQPTSRPSEEPTSQPSGSQGETASEPPRTEQSLLAWGRPLGRPAVNALDSSRYAGLNADPLLQLGGDLRLAGLLTDNGAYVFPMQLEVSAVVHPVEHLLIFVEGAAWGSPGGVGDEIAGKPVDPFGLHEAFVMTHEWPGFAYLKLGRFTPPFGTRLDDHTAFVRRQLGLDQGRPESWVSGGEAGFALNYPYLNVAVFQLDAGQLDFVTGDTGTGVSGTAGWRDLSFGLGGSFWHSSGPEEDRLMLGINGHLNPWRPWPNIPLTWLFEVDWIELRPSYTTRTVHQLAAFQELDWRLRSGVNLRLRHDFWDPDLAVAGDHIHRLNLQADLFPYRYLAVQVVTRVNLPATGRTGADLLLILRAWL